MSRYTFPHELKVFLQTVEARYPGDEGFVHEIQRGLDLLASLPDELELDVDESLAVGALRRRGMGRGESLVTLVHNAHAWVAFARYTSAVRTGHMVLDIVTGFESGNGWRVTSAARTLVEDSAVLHALDSELQDPVRRFGEGNGLEETLGPLVEIYNASARHGRATRFNWKAGVRGDMEEFYQRPEEVDEGVKAKNILTLLGKLPQSEKRAARWFYSMLCDFVHVNTGSHMLCADVVTPRPHGMRMKLSVRPTSDEFREMVAHVIAIPVRHALRVTIDVVERLESLSRGLGDLARNLGGA